MNHQRRNTTRCVMLQMVSGCNYKTDRVSRLKTIGPTDDVSLQYIMHTVLGSYENIACSRVMSHFTSVCACESSSQSTSPNIHSHTTRQPVRGLPALNPHSHRCEFRYGRCVVCQTQPQIEAVSLTDNGGTTIKYSITGDKAVSSVEFLLGRK